MRRLVLLTLVLATVACDEKRPTSTIPRTPSPLCGNRRVDKGETCDSAITSTAAGACATSCDDGVACTSDRLLGSAESCNAACGYQPISACVNADGCCPMGCTGATDNDCSSTCGNNLVDARETCDGNCPGSCDDRNNCTQDAPYGHSATCSLSCGYQVLRECMNGDGCCPDGCSAGDDGDCSSTCGNGVVDPEKETCDGNCPTTCVDADACTLDLRTGTPSSCNVTCTHPPITACRAGDGCCPTACTAQNDSDCSATCGNGMLDSGELCDGTSCPTSCPTPSDACMPTRLVGTARACNARCMPMPISACMGGDGCCPSSCNPSNDSDCRPPPSSSIGAACTSPSSCTGLSSGATCLLDGYPGGYCSQFCTSGGCPSGSTCDSNFLCIQVCDPANNNCRSDYSCHTGLGRDERPFFGCFPPN